MTSNFEWDEEKAKANLKKHKIAFDEATTVFSDPFSIIISDPDNSASEERYIDIGMSERGRILVVSYTERGANIASSVAVEQMQLNGDTMKKALHRTTNGNAMRAEYDFTGGVHGKHYRAMQSGYTITIRKPDGTRVVKEVKPTKGTIVLEPDVRKYFPDSNSVNVTLRSLIRLIRTQRKSIPRKHGA